MTAIRSAIQATRRPGELGVHSVDRFHFAVPDLAVAKNFYGEFGLEVDEDGEFLAMKTRGNPHVWVTLGEGPRKKLGHISFGAFEDDLDRFAEREVRVFGGLCRPRRAWRAVPARRWARQAPAPRACPPVHARCREGGSVLYAHPGLAPLRPIRRRHRLPARDSRQRSSYDRLRAFERAGAAPSELGRGLRRRHRSRRHAYA